MKIPFSIQAALGAYELLLTAVMPLLRINKYIREGFSQRQLKTGPLPTAEIWIQAASVGEAYLAVELVKNFQKLGKSNILLSATTRQGKDVLEKELGLTCKNQAENRPQTIYFPFDRPSFMKRALTMIAPRLVILLESEIWPGLLAASKQTGSMIAMVNSRMSESSCKVYSLWPALWKFLCPEMILAVTDNDADRFARVFGNQNIAVMTNIKFDRMLQDEQGEPTANPLAGIIPHSGRFLVLGSIRKEEEEVISQALDKITRRHPDLIIGLFPRHPVRVREWERLLTTHGFKWRLRSATTAEVENGTIILWDIFGELSHAYELATSAFIGGSLAPLGGQNFLEALTSGIVPIIGPDWSDFSWVGQNIIQEGLLIQVENWRELVKAIDRQLANPSDRKVIRHKARNYIRNKQGGTRMACEKIMPYLMKDMQGATKNDRGIIPRR